MESAECGNWSVEGQLPEPLCSVVEWPFGQQGPVGFVRVFDVPFDIAMRAIRSDDPVGYLTALGYEKFNEADNATNDRSNP
jgi:hypothetical protein